MSELAENTLQSTTARYSIELREGIVTWISPEDIELVRNYHWFLNRKRNGVYAAAKVKVEGIWRTVYLHRLIMNAPRGMEVDHIDQNGLNNVRSNLRLATHRQNRRNSTPQNKPGKTSRFKGVSWHKQYAKWRAQIKNDQSETVYLGSSDSEEEAARMYDSAAIERYGEFAKLNFPT